ncbi:TRAP transporter large permease subunit [Bradyrhizobium sp. 190]|nr:TRAP transporter large permease subunit [Bradyrhizobium sp. 190]MCK1513219.1 TRAP transporter large permease subunit [Bradyrhizobium sp. 190]
MVLFGPMLFPVARALGVHEVQYAIVAILAMGFGLFSPSFGIGFHSACAIGKVDPADASKVIWPHMAALGAGLLIVAGVPWISTVFVK